MPLLSTRGAGSAKGFGFTAGGSVPVDFDYLVVAGGGNSGYNGAGSGAGGYRTSFPGGTKITIDPGNTPITVGGGGGYNSNGGPSIFKTITSAGGGYGPRDGFTGNPAGGDNAGANGGSGGGGGPLAWPGAPGSP